MRKNTGKTTESAPAKPYIDFHEWHVENLRDAEAARMYLQIALEEYEEDKDAEAFLLALRSVTEAQGGVGELAKRTSLNRQSLYKALSSKGNPRLDTLGTILHGLGFKLSVESL